jgi:predicted  nucleic acid-binding Zn-ribbon protein
MQELQSKSNGDATNLEVGRGVSEMLQITYDQLTSDKEDKECDNKIEQGLTTVYDHIPESVQSPERSAEEKIKIILQTVQGYRKEIEDLKQNINPTTPLEVRE